MILERILSPNPMTIEPGGYLHWDEMDFNTFYPSVVGPIATKTAADDFMSKWRSELSKSSVLFE